MTSRSQPSMKQLGWRSAPAFFGWMEELRSYMAQGEEFTYLGIWLDEVLWTLKSGGHEGKKSWGKEDWYWQILAAKLVPSVGCLKDEEPAEVVQPCPSGRRAWDPKDTLERFYLPTGLAMPLQFSLRSCWKWFGKETSGLTFPLRLLHTWPRPGYAVGRWRSRQTRVIIYQLHFHSIPRDSSASLQLQPVWNVLAAMYSQKKAQFLLD